MSRKPLSIREVGRMFGFELPEPGSGKAARSKCPFRKHKRRDPTFRVYRSRSDGSPLWKCWSCDSPNNVGNAIKLYSLLGACDMKVAWRKLLDEGYAVPFAHDDDGGGRGGRESQEDRERLAYQRTQKNTVHAIPIRGTRPELILPLERARWDKWAARRTDRMDKFAQKRGMDAAFLREHGVVEMGGPYVGFTYFDLATGQPCRVKVRGTEEKKFWVEPRPPEGDTSGARALDVLYLAHELLAVNRLQPVIITEGELDALAVRYCGIMNVVSLPDGNESAMTADLSPIYQRFGIWFVATDNDPQGEAAYRMLRARAAGMAMVIRIKWEKLIDGELMAYKDANEALLAGFTREDYLRCMTLAAEARFLPVEWRLAG